VYVTGTFDDEVDFDPGPGEDLHLVEDTCTFVLHLEQGGDYAWARSVGGESSQTIATGVAAALDGSVFVAGTFDGEVDLDPGPGVDTHVAEFPSGLFLLGLDGSGRHLWARSITGTDAEVLAGGVAAGPEGSVAVTGCFNGPADLDPGPAEDVRSPVSSFFWAAMLLRFDSAGSREWAAVLESTGASDCGRAVAMTDSGRAVLAGVFDATIDLDPGPALDARTTARGDTSPFLVLLDRTGDYEWGGTIGGASWAEALAVAAGLDGSVAVAGFFTETTDLDPGPGVDEHASVGDWDAFVARVVPAAGDGP
jgi:hypothetical protein